MKTTKAKKKTEYWRNRARRAERQVKKLLSREHPVFTWLDQYHPGMKKQFIGHVLEHLYE